MKSYDLNLHPKNPKEAAGIINTAERLGWHGICLVEYFDDMNNFKKFREEILNLKKNTKLEIFIGAEIKGKNNEDIKRNARKSMDHADMTFACGNFNINREFAECFEIDVLCHPERDVQRDFMDQKNSGIDHIIAKLLTDHKTALEINFSDILSSYGVVRAQIMGRMSQNIKLARKYNCLSILTSGADNVYGMRAAQELVSIGKSLGMTEKEARDSVSKNPEKIIQKFLDRKNPGVITSGLKVINWGEQKPKEKKMFGMY